MYEKFPHLTNNESDFPIIDNVDVYKYDNDFDYSRYDYEQMHLQICNVPWDMGEAHIGNRVISGIGNVVYFESSAKRDKWFDDIPDNKCERFDTKFKELHRNMFIDVPIPYDVCARYNYLCVHYELFANANSPVEYEKDGGILDWFWFIREVEFLAPNTTRLHIMLDAFQTFIYDINVTSMILERGHAPLFATNADTYLANPVNNNQYLLAPDVDYGDVPSIAKHSEEIIFNAGNMKAVIITTANPYNGSWGSKADGNWKCASGHFTVQGTESYCAFAIDATSLTSFLANIDSSIPQFMQTIKAICFISSNYITLGSSFTFANTSCKLISAGYTTSDLYTFDKNDFGYPANCRDFAKLYTYPYAQLVITDENGDSSIVRIEDCKGKLQLKSKIGLVWPWLRVNGHLSGIGKTASKTISFYNISSNSISIEGNWYDYLYDWDIPTFGVTQDASVNNDFATHFDRLQQSTAGTNQYNNEIDSATAALYDANATAANTLANASNSSTTTLSNANLQIALNNANTAAGNAHANTSADINVAQAAGNTAAASALTGNSTNNQIDYQYATGTTAAVSSGVSGAVNGATAMAGGGPIASAAAAASSGVINVVSSLLTMQAGINYTSAQLEAANDQMGRNLAVTETAAYDETSAAITEANARNTAANSYTSGVANNNAALINNNAYNDASTINANAARDYNAASSIATRNLNTVNSAISNQQNQAALMSQFEYGDFSNGETATSRPMGLFCNVVTQNDYAIRRTADEFARYGYRYDGQWQFDGNWNIGKYFTYWKLRDFWIENISIPDMYIDQIRFFLLEGVTIWRNPESIGKVSVYQNVG